MSNRELAVDAKLLEELQLTRAQLGLTGKPCLSEDDVNRLHEELEVTLEDDVLAIFAMLERDLRQVVVLTEELREEGLPNSYIAILTDPERFTWCLRKGKNTLTAWPAKTNLPKTLDAIVRRFRVIDAVEQQDDDDDDAPELDEGFDEDLDLGDEDSEDRDEDGDDDGEDREDREVAEDLAPKPKAKPIKRTPKPAKKKAAAKPKREPRPVEHVVPWIVASVRQEKWVSHPRFGRGRVLREVKDGRHFLEIAFEDGTTRKLLAEFVKDA
jgi:hypothetical protein